MPDLYTKPHTPRLVRVDGGWLLTGAPEGVMDKAAMLWFAKSVLDALMAALVETR
jgi:hypothetical protein